jgi:hypothetical protein
MNPDVLADVPNFHEWSPVTREVRSTDIARIRFGWRDLILIIAAAVSISGSVYAVQSGLRSDVRDLLTKMESYQQQQNEYNSSIQRQIDEWRAETKLNRVNINNNEREMAELKGILMGAGIKGITK